MLRRLGANNGIDARGEIDLTARCFLRRHLKPTVLARSKTRCLEVKPFRALGIVFGNLCRNEVTECRASTMRMCIAVERFIAPQKVRFIGHRPDRIRREHHCRLQMPAQRFALSGGEPVVASLTAWVNSDMSPVSLRRDGDFHFRQIRSVFSGAQRLREIRYHRKQSEPQIAPHRCGWGDRKQRPNPVIRVDQSFALKKHRKVGSVFGTCVCLPAAQTEGNQANRHCSADQTDPQRSPRK